MLRMPGVLLGLCFSGEEGQGTYDDGDVEHQVWYLASSISECWAD